MNLFSDIEFLPTCIIYKINKGISVDSVKAYLDSAWADDKGMRWTFYGDSMVHLYRAWSAPEDESDSDSDEDASDSDDDE